MQQAGARNVLIKGGHFQADSQVSRDFLFADDEMTIFDSNRVHNVNVRGTGCILSSAIAANLALGHELGTAVRISKDYVYDVIKQAGDSTAETVTGNEQPTWLE
jgi:hydroxymethylpyrimidine/phosphomethylpyrimidine kinase